MTNSHPTSVHVPNKAPARAHRGYHEIFEDLQQRIRQGNWLPGTRLPSIVQLAKEFKVGAGSIREALRALQSIGLVKIEHGSGVYITGSRPFTELSSHFQNVGEGQLIALAETRCILEPELAALAAERGTNDEINEIEELARQMEEVAKSGHDFAELDVLFHRKISRAARNPILYQTIEGVSDLFLESRRKILMDLGSMQRSVRYHSLIADALQSRNAPQARLLMQAHMNSMLSDVLDVERREKLNRIPVEEI
jgi:GntR family transcriptional regulator, transcriptional repressor for pyruvate dehydrogenase complex